MSIHMNLVCLYKYQDKYLAVTHTHQYQRKFSYQQPIYSLHCMYIDMNHMYLHIYDRKYLDFHRIRLYLHILYHLLNIHFYNYILLNLHQLMNIQHFYGTPRFLFCNLYLIRDLIIFYFESILNEEFLIKRWIVIHPIIWICKSID